MNPSTILWALVAVGSLAMAAQGACTFDTFRACYTSRRLNVTESKNLTDLLVEFNSNGFKPDVICGNIGTYKLAMACVMNTSQNCPPPYNTSLPDTEEVKKGMDYLCNNTGEFDSKCFESKAQSIEDCETKLRNDPGIKDKSNCTVYDFNYDCSKKHLESCEKKTTEILLKLLNDYYLPKQCYGMRPARKRKSYVTSGCSRHFALPVSGLVTMVLLFLRP